MLKNSREEELSYKIDDKGTKDIAILVHGLTGHIEADYMPNLATQIKITSIRFDFAGNGGS